MFVTAWEISSTNASKPHLIDVDEKSSFSLPSAWGWATFAYVALRGRKLPDRRSPYTTGFFTVSLNFPLIHHNMSNFIHKWCIIAVTTFINQHKQVMGGLWYRKFHLSCFVFDGSFVGHTCIIFSTANLCNYGHPFCRCVLLALLLVPWFCFSIVDPEKFIATSVCAAPGTNFNPPQSKHRTSW